jgi:ankyrin repeat protein
MNNITDQDFQDDPLDLTNYAYLDAPDALVIAACNGDGRLVDHLLATGHDINLRDEDGCTALFQAVDQTYWGLAIYLLELGADPNITNNEGDSPLDIAKYSHLYKHSKNSEMVDALIKAGGLCKSGPSARELLDDKVHAGFSHVSAMKNLFALIEKNKK